MGKHTISLIALLFAACTHQELSTGICGQRGADECAIELWSQVELGRAGHSVELSSTCRETVESTQIITKPASDMQALCGSGGTKVDGCLVHYAQDGSTAYVSDTESGQTVETSAHELMHVILECTQGDPDFFHKHGFWAGLME